MAVAITIGATFFELFYSYMYPVLPLDEGERVVGIENWDTAANNQDCRSLHDFVTWRGELKFVEDLGAFRPFGRNLITQHDVAEPLPGAEMSASGFRLARVLPLLGRPLVEQDEREGAPPVVVIGYDLWRTYLASDPAVVGRILQLGDTPVHGGRRHAGRLRLPAEQPFLGSTASGPIGLRAAAGAGCPGGAPARQACGG